MTGAVGEWMLELLEIRKGTAQQNQNETRHTLHSCPLLKLWSRLSNLDKSQLAIKEHLRIGLRIN